MLSSLMATCSFVLTCSRRAACGGNRREPRSGGGTTASAAGGECCRRFSATQRALVETAADRRCPERGSTGQRQRESGHCRESATAVGYAERGRFHLRSCRGRCRQMNPTRSSAPDDTSHPRPEAPSAPAATRRKSQDIVAAAQAVIHYGLCR